ncbi:MAG: ABC transporter substrate-binding protein [Anaerolineae bacterium]
MSKITRRDFLRLSTVAAAGVLAAACAKTAAPTATPEPKVAATTATPAPKAAEPTPVPAAVWPRGEVPRNRTLVRMFTGIEGDVGKGHCYIMTHQSSMASMYEPMFFYAALNDKAYNHLAESYEYNADATELTVYLRKGIEWSDGSPFTATDIAFTYNSLIKFAPDLRDSARIATLLNEAVAVDDHTVKFMLKKPNFRFHFTECTYRFDRGTYIMPEKVFKDVPDWREFMFHRDQNPDWPLVTGCYKLSDDTVTHRHYDRRDDWWAYKTGFFSALPEPERIVHIPAADDTVMAQMVINNEVDETLDVRPRTMESILIRAPQVTSFSGREKPYGYVDWWPISMYFNTLEEPYTDPRVRWAMAYAVDQEQLVEVGFIGAGKSTAHFYPDYPGLLRYMDSISDILAEYNPLEVNLDKSADLMRQAGFEKDAEGFWVKDGKRPDANIWAGVPLFGDIAPITAEQLRKAGFDANHVTPPDVWAGKNDGRCRQSGAADAQGHGGR